MLRRFYAYKEQVTAIVDKAPVASKPLFTTYDSYIDNHHFHAAYCAALLRQLEQEQALGKPWFGGDLNAQNYIHLSGRDKHVSDPYRGYPTQVVATVSGAMSHNRLEIIFPHYKSYRLIVC